MSAPASAHRYIATPLSESWGIATVAPKAEESVASALKRAGVEAYYPKKARWHINARGKRRVEGPILSGYVFFRLDSPDDERHLSGVDGLVNCLRIGRALYMIPKELNEEGVAHHWVTTTRDQETRGDFDSTIDRTPDFKPGERVRILAGAFADRLAKVISAGKKDVRLELEGVGWRKTLKKQDIAHDEAA